MSIPSSPDDSGAFATLVQAALHAAEDRAALSLLPGLFSAFMSATVCDLVLWNADGEPEEVHSDRADTEIFERYKARRSFERDLSLAIVASQEAGRVASIHLDVHRKVTSNARSDALIFAPFKNETGRTLAVRLPLLRGGWTLGVHRAPPAEPFDTAAAARMQALVTPLDRALRLRERLAASGTDLAADALDQISTAVINVGADGRVRYMNLQARRWLQRGEGLAIRRERLQLDDAEAAARLQAALDAVRRGDRADAVFVPRGRGRGSYLAVVTGGGRAAQDSLVLRLYPADSTAAPDRLLQALFGFTSAEAELARLLIGGATPQEAAGRRGVRITTVRTQITSILTKTGARRLTEAVALLCTLAPIAPLD